MKKKKKRNNKIVSKKLVKKKVARVTLSSKNQNSYQKCLNKSKQIICSIKRICVNLKIDLKHLYESSIINVKKINLSFSINLFPKSVNKKVARFEPPYKLFSDDPIQNDSEDLLDRDSIAQQIVYAVKSTKGQLNFLISGEWGIGKTSILESIKRLLKAQNICFIWFSPWKYSKSYEGTNPISRAFLVKLADTFGKSYLVKDLYIKREVETERGWVTQVLLLILIFLKYILYVGVLFIVINFILTSLIFLKFDVSNFSSSLLKAINLGFIVTDIPWQMSLTLAVFFALPKLGEDFINKIREKGEVEKVTSPELLEKKFNQIIDESLKNRIIQLILSYWEEMVQDVFPFSLLGQPLTKRLYKTIFNKLRINRLVVFVDDLDRCNKEEVQEYLAGMKTFLDKDNVYYLIAADVNKLRTYTSAEEPEYLRKIIHLDWNVPQLSLIDRKNLVASTLDYIENQLPLFSNREKSVTQMSYLFACTPNPRAIKYYLRKLIFLINNNQVSPNPQNISTDQEKMYLLKLIMIAYESLDIYQYLSSHSEIIFDIEKGNHNLMHYREELPIAVNPNEKGSNLAKVIQSITSILRAEPHIDAVQIKLSLSNMFKIVASFEGSSSQASEFNNQAKINPENALKLLENIYWWNYEDRISALSADISQDIEKIKQLGQGEVTTDLTLRIRDVKNQVDTAILVFKSQRFKEENNRSNLFINFLSIFLSVWNAPGLLKSTLSDSQRNDLLNMAIDINAENFWNELLMQDIYKTDYDEFKKLVIPIQNKLQENFIVKNILLNSYANFIISNDQLSDRLIFLSTDITTNLSGADILQKRLLELYRTEQAQKLLLAEFLLQITMSDEKLFNLYKYLLENKEYKFLEMALKANKSQLYKLMSVRKEVFHKFISDNLDLTNQEFVQLLLALYAGDINNTLGFGKDDRFLLRLNELMNGEIPIDTRISIIDGVVNFLRRHEFFVGPQYIPILGNRKKLNSFYGQLNHKPAEPFFSDEQNKKIISIKSKIAKLMSKFGGGGNARRGKSAN